MITVATVYQSVKLKNASPRLPSFSVAIIPIEKASAPLKPENQSKKAWPN